MAIVHIALGANLGDPLAQLDEAVRRLEPAGVRVLARAPNYRTRPVGPPGQPDYVNSAVRAETALEPLELLDALKSIEAEMGRQAGVRWGPRLIDLDLALYGERALQHPRLTVPHRELPHRRFVLVPLAALSPDHPVPGQAATVAELLSRLPEDPGELQPIEAGGDTG